MTKKLGFTKKHNIYYYFDAISNTYLHKIVCLFFEWKPSEKKGRASLLGFSIMSLAFLGMLPPGCFSTGCPLSNGILGHTNIPNS